MSSKEFNLISENLDGINLIEAGAGTGKTFTVSVLYLRFICEKGFSPKEITAVTFTKAAAAEMKGRIYKFLSTAYDYTKSGKKDECENEIILDYIEALKRNIPTETILRRLEKALLYIDESVISTIHSFCMKLISEFSFETNSDFSIEPVSNTDDILNQISEDFWRINIQTLPTLEYELCQNIIHGHNELNSYLRSIIAHSELTLKNIPNSKINIESLHKNIIEQAKALYSLWIDEKKNIKDCINDPDNGFNKRSYNSKFVENNFTKIESELTSIKNGYNLFEIDLKKLTLAKVSANEILSKSQNAQIKHQFFKEADSFMQLMNEFKINMEQFKLWIIGNYIEFFKEKYSSIKKIRNICDYNDLIRNVSESINKNSEVRDLISKKYRVAFVDEFQDTDREQFYIFKNIFSSKGSSLFLVGDPKQAIYRFRGGDVYAYLEATKSSEIKKFTLTKNFRSAKQIIESINVIFRSSDNPFLNTNITYPEAKSGNIEVKLPEGEKPVTVFTYSEGKENKIKKLARERTLAEISRLLSENTTITNVKVLPSDIAILVKKNSDAQLFKGELNALNIPAITLRSGNIFESDEFNAIIRIMETIIDLSNIGKLKATLHMFPFDISTAEIEESLYEHLNSFFNYRTIWEENGFSAMFYALIKEFSIVDTLLTNGLSGNRSLVNFRHILELISTEENRKRYSPQELKEIIITLSQNLDSSVSQERLESDSQSVKIITVHSSKGLEFPIVFIPFTWELTTFSKKNSKTIVYHNSSNELILDFDTDTNFDLFKQESEEELRRLFYVALTRSASKIYISQIANGKESFPENKIFIEHKTLFEIEEVVEQNTIVSTNQKEIKQSYITAKKLTRAPFGLITKSYSSLAISEHQQLPASKYSTDNSLLFPPGSTTGKAWHRIFELAEYDNSATYKPSIVKAMAEFGFKQGAYSVEAMENMVSNVLNKEMDDKLSHVKLSNLEKSFYKTELEFLLKAPKLDTKALANAINKYGSIKTPMNESSFSGFLKGFMDLVFFANNRYYILDWKSNFLGASILDYSENRIQTAMTENNYHLQYILYSVALSIILGMNNNNFNYEENFGGVFYIFLRGINQKNNNGIFYTLPDKKLISELIKFFK